MIDEVKVKYTGPCESCGGSRAVHERNFDLMTGADLGPMTSYSDSKYCFSCWNLIRLKKKPSLWNKIKQSLHWHWLEDYSFSSCIDGTREERQSLQFRYIVEGDQTLETTIYPALKKAAELLYEETADPKYYHDATEYERRMNP